MTLGLDGLVSDEELTALAMAAGPEVAVPHDAVPFSSVGGAEPALLPSWYMPCPAAGGRQLRGWRRWLVILVVAAFLLIEAYGLCSTYGPIAPA